ENQLIIKSSPKEALDFQGRKVLQLAYNEEHACVVVDSHQVRCWGYNARGQLGYGDKRHRFKPGPDVDLGRQKVLEVQCGGLHTCALLQDKSMKCWGHNAQGQLGYTDIKDRYKPDANALPFGERRVVQFSLGEDHSCAVLDDQTVRCWGQDSLSHMTQQQSQAPLRFPLFESAIQH
ncbi:MAG: hypothetical protein AAGJ35_05880, partial [Myxococcota bacterium]